MLDPSTPFKQMEAREALLRTIFDGLLITLKPDIVGDIGAFNGDETVRFAQLHPEAKLFSFEANKQNIDQFWPDKVSQLPQLQLEHMAVTDYDGEIDFNILEIDDNINDLNHWKRGGSSIRKRNDDLPTKIEKVSCTTLDNYFGKLGLMEKTFMLWLDVEGGLDSVLNGAKNVLQRTMVLRAEVEHKELWSSQVLSAEIREFLYSEGFVELGDSFIPDAYDQSDVLMVHSRISQLICGT